jgi:hypothetical protein
MTAVFNALGMNEVWLKFFDMRLGIFGANLSGRVREIERQL